MKRILEVMGEPILNGGEETFIVNFISHMNLDGISIDLLTPYYCANEYYKQIILDCGGQVYELHEQFKPGKSRFNIRNSLKAFFKINQYDVVHIHSGSTSILALVSYYAKHSGVKKVIVHSHSAGNINNYKKKILRLICGTIMHFNVDLYLACSDNAAKDKFGDTITKNKVIIIKNGIDIQRFSFNKGVRKKIRNQLNIMDNQLLIGQVGRFSDEKNHDFTLKIFREILRIKPNSNLLFIGDGNLKDYVRQKAIAMQLEENIIFTGVVNNVEDYLCAMDVFVLPSKFEGMPLVGIEAQANGLPSFVSDVCSPDLKMTNNFNFLSLKLSPEAWAKYILKGKRENYELSCNEIKRLGYDINSTAFILRKIYIN